MKQRPKDLQNMPKDRLHDICARGEKADKHLQEGRARDAVKTYSDLAKDLEAKGDFDSYLAAKVTLGMLHGYVKMGDFQSAYDVWNAHVEDSLHGIGIYALESAQTTVQDLVTYDMLCAFLHTLGDADKAISAAAVNQYLSRVCEHALEDGHRGVMKMAISNWKKHLREIYGNSFPMAVAQPLIKFEKVFGDTVKPEPLNFPMGSPWEKPNDFLEMSRFTEIRQVKRPNGKKQRAS